MAFYRRRFKRRFVRSGFRSGYRRFYGKRRYSGRRSSFSGRRSSRGKNYVTVFGSAGDKIRVRINDPVKREGIRIQNAARKLELWKAHYQQRAETLASLVVPIFSTTVPNVNTGDAAMNEYKRMKLAGAV